MSARRTFDHSAGIFKGKWHSGTDAFFHDGSVKASNLPFDLGQNGDVFMCIILLIRLKYIDVERSIRGDEPAEEGGHQVILKLTDIMIIFMLSREFLLYYM